MGGGPCQAIRVVAVDVEPDAPLAGHDEPRGQRRGQTGEGPAPTGQDRAVSRVGSGADTRIKTEDLLFANPQGASSRVPTRDGRDPIDSCVCNYLCTSTSHNSRYWPAIPQDRYG